MPSDLSPDANAGIDDPFSFTGEVFCERKLSRLYRRPLCIGRAADNTSPSQLDSEEQSMRPNVGA
jgi:hypothetical protein